MVMTQMNYLTIGQLAYATTTVISHIASVLLLV